MLPWSEIDFVLLDMDGTLLDRYFDDYFWEEHVPKVYAAQNNIPYAKARKKLLAMYKTEEKTLNWTDLHYWSNRLNLDIIAIKVSLKDRVSVHPGVEPFLRFLRDDNKEVILVTNAHPRSVQIKLEQTLLLPYFHTILCSSDIGLPKEEIGFWRDAERVLGFDKERSLFVDDNEDVLLAAYTFGIRHLLHKNGASSKFIHERSEIFPPLVHFTDLIP